MPGAPAVPEDEQAEARAGNLLGLDPPEHQRLRRMLTGEFTVRRMKRLEPRIVEIVEQQLDEMEGQDPPADLVAHFALPIPSLVICELLGVDYADRAEFQEHTGIALNLTKSDEERDRLYYLLAVNHVGRAKIVKVDGDTWRDLTADLEVPNYARGNVPLRARCARSGGEMRLQLWAGEAVQRGQAGAGNGSAWHFADHVAFHVEHPAPGGAREARVQAFLRAADRFQRAQRVDRLDDPRSGDGGAEARSQLHHVHVVVGVAECDGGGETADSAADDQDVASAHINHPRSFVSRRFRTQIPCTFICIITLRVWEAAARPCAVER